MNELELLNGVGIKTAKILNRLGIYSKQDLIEYYPFRYEILERTNIDKLEQDDKVVIDGVSERIPNVFFFSKKFNKMEFLLNTGNNIYKVIIAKNKPIIILVLFFNLLIILIFPYSFIILILYVFEYLDNNL